VARYRGRYAMGWDVLREERRRRMIDLGLIDESAALTARDPDVPVWDALEPEERVWFERAMEVYAAQIDRMDQGIGRLVEAIEAGGRLNDTLILFLADNGGCAEVLSPSWRGLHIPRGTRDGRPVAVGNDVATLPGPEESYQSYGPHWANVSNTPFRLYKHWVHEGGIATPLIVHWPKRLTRRGAIVDEVGHVVDVMATVLDAAGASYPEERQGHAVAPLAGVSLLPALEGGEFERGPIFFEHEGNRAVRDGRWKLVSRYPGPWELYDMETDRSETRDLAADRPDEVGRLTALYRDWAERNDVLDWGALQEARAAARTSREVAERPAR
jgi:arylsulfatase